LQFVCYESRMATTKRPKTDAVGTKKPAVLEIVNHGRTVHRTFSTKNYIPDI